MQESEWLKSKDPYAMLKLIERTSDEGLVIAIPRQPSFRISDRKLSLFAVACCWSVSARIGQDAETIMEWSSGPASNPQSWAMAWAGDQKKPTAAERADILRDIIGNPWRPVPPMWDMVPNKTGEVKIPIPADGYDWLWDDRADNILPIVEAAYTERPGIVCEACNRDGKIYKYGTRWDKGRVCPTCHGSGRIEDGTLDPVRLAILADALEEAGCQDERCGCIGCDGIGWYNEMGPNTFPKKCNQCDGKGYWIQPNPILAHLRSPGPHYRGCWALDLVLGKE